MEYDGLERFFAASKIRLQDHENDTLIELDGIVPRMNDLSGLSHAEMIPMIACFRAILELSEDEDARSLLRTAATDLGMRVDYR